MAWFKRASLTYNPPIENDSPFARARQEWDDRMGSCLVRARNWRAMAFATTALAMVLGVSLTLLAFQNRFEVVFVPVDEFGKPGRLQHLDKQYHVQDGWVAYAVRQLVEQVRSIPTDPVVLRENWDRAYKFLAGDAVTRMSEYGSSLEALRSGPTKARSVEVSNVLKQSDTTLQVSWVERTYRDGSLEATARYTGLFTYTLRQPSSEQEAFDNPLGVLVTDFSWSEEFDAGL
jgi:type IV secretion system protein VirB5